MIHTTALILGLMTSCEKSTDTATPIYPAGGDWRVLQGASWEGDCALADMDTRFTPETTWWMDPRDDVLIIYTTPWDVLSCDLDGPQFTCDLGSWTYEEYSSMTYLLTGTFTRNTAFTGTTSIALVCGDPSLARELRNSYGEDLEFPCSVEASVEGELAD